MTSDPPWIQAGKSQLFGVPSAHNRLVFAQYVIEACRRRPFDVIAVELPASLQQAGALALVRGLDLTPALLLEHTPGQKGQKHPSARLYPVSPCDSIVMALQCPTLPAVRRPGWNPEIAFIDAEPNTWRSAPAGALHCDDYAARARGLATWVEESAPLWEGGRVEDQDSFRERVMAARLRRFLQQGKSVLLVCGAAHWSRICLRLENEQEAQPSEAPVPVRRLRLLTAHPRSFWMAGMLDDLPFVTAEFLESCRSGEDFDKPEAVRNLIEAAFQLGRERDVRLSARRMIAMTRLLGRILASHKRWTPLLGNHLLPVAAACVEPRFERCLQDVALRFPESLEPHGGKAKIEFEEGGGCVVRLGEETFEIENPPSDGPVFPIFERDVLTPEEKKQMREALHARGLVYREPDLERDLHNDLIHRARQIAHRQSPEPLLRPFRGDFGEGLDIRQTVRARAAGQQTPWVRMPRKQAAAECDGRCPVVWVWEPDAPIVGTFPGYVPKERGTSVPLCYSTFYWLSARESFANGIATRQRCAYAVSLMRGMMPWPGWSIDAARRLVDSFPPHRRALVPPWYDASLARFHGVDLALSTAIKYAADHMVLVSAAPLQVSEGVAEFARHKGVTILRVGRGEFHERSLERLALDHNVVAASHTDPPFAWSLRLVPPVE